jgi:SAM-dependent methyltransferase
MLAEQSTAEFFFSHAGECPICEQSVTFVAKGPLFRNTLRCERCKSAPRNRALMHVLKMNFPNWKKLAIHESSPAWDRVSYRLAAECELYIASQYDVTVPFGEMVDAPRLPCKRYRSENLECQTFPDNLFDVVLMQDVFEHIFEPDKAIKEITRTLKPGGALIMTVPITRGRRTSQRRASLVDGQVRHLLEPPQFHGNPVGNDGSLVTIDWGYDIVSYLQHHSGMPFRIMSIDDIDRGIRAQLNEVLIGCKVPMPHL